MATDWDKLKTLEDWSDTLRAFLEKGSAAILNKDVPAMKRSQASLIEFRENSPNYEVAGIDKLDEIAYRMITDLTKAALGQALDDMDSRTDQLIQYMKEVKAISDDARKAANLISLERFTKVVENVDDLIKKARSLSKSLGDGSTDATKLQEAFDGVREILHDLEAVKNQFTSDK